jgi:hypothetical protein
LGPRVRAGRTGRRCALLLAVLVATLTASQPVARQGPGAANIQTVFGQFVHLDRQLARAIDRAEKGEDVLGLIHQIEDGKVTIVDQHMSMPIDGVSGAVWFRQLDCVDQHLDRAGSVGPGSCNAYRRSGRALGLRPGGGLSSATSNAVGSVLTALDSPAFVREQVRSVELRLPRC